MRSMSVPNRHFMLPVTFTHRKLKDAMDRYMTNQRPTTTYLPDPFKYLAEINGMSPDQSKEQALNIRGGVFGVGFFMALSVLLAADPRQRLRCPKMNPSRTYTPQGCLAWVGCAMSIYPMDAPGGYIPIGMTMPSVGIFGTKCGFTK